MRLLRRKSELERPVDSVGDSLAALAGGISKAQRDEGGPDCGRRGCG